MKKHILIILLFFCAADISFSQPFSKKYVMSFLTCDSACTGPQDHWTYLAESDDGSSWTLVPNYTPYHGSVPDVITRNDELYIYTPGFVKRYNLSADTWDSSPVNVTIEDSIGGNVLFVDPSAIVDSAGNIVLFFLNTTNIPMGQDPAGCQTYPCTKYFDSATEVAGSDGTQFIKNDGHRKYIKLFSGSASDPDIFFDGSRYLLYISRGGSTNALQSFSLHGTYDTIPELGTLVLTNQGAVASGIFDEQSSMYWTFAHANSSGHTVIKSAVHSGFTSQLTSLNTVLSASMIGMSTTTNVESPGICENGFLTLGLSDETENNMLIYPNPVSENLHVFIKDSYSKALAEIFSATGKSLFSSVLKNEDNSFDMYELPQGIYFLKINLDDRTMTKKIIRM